MFKCSDQIRMTPNFENRIRFRPHFEHKSGSDENTGIRIRNPSAKEANIFFRRTNTFHTASLVFQNLQFTGIKF